MRFGFVASFGSVEQVVGMARAAEGHGWDGFFTWDGISVGPVHTWDPWVVLGAAATVTSRIRLGAMVFPLARRRRWKVARETVTVDHLSHGRLVLPVCLGAAEDGGFGRVGGEGTSARERAERLDECLEILRRGWTGEAFSFTGRHYTVDDLVLAPPPVQRPRIPVWPVAGWRSERSMARAARWDGAVLQRVGGGEPLSPDEVREAVTWLAARRSADGAAGERYDVVVDGVLDADPAAAGDRVTALAEAGATWWVESRWDTRRDTPEVLLARIRQGPPVV